MVNIAQHSQYQPMCDLHRRGIASRLVGLTGNWILEGVAPLHRR
jgi:hypothetical protein